MVVRGAEQLHFGLPYAIRLLYQSKPLQLDCNQGNHSVVKITNLFLQCVYVRTTTQEIFVGLVQTDFCE